jgi:TRAP-type mannitol/chloroaromatic compound transport system permease large subunit
MTRIGSMLVRTLVHCAIPALAASLVILALNHILDRTLMGTASAAAGGAMGGCLGGLIASLTDRRQDA